jgi:hypothetical protein
MIRKQKVYHQIQDHSGVHVDEIYSGKYYKFFLVCSLPPKFRIFFCNNIFNECYDKKVLEEKKGEGMGCNLKELCGRNASVFVGAGIIPRIIRLITLDKALKLYITKEGINESIAFVVKNRLNGEKI